MHAIPSGVRICLNKIAQNVVTRKLRGKASLHFCGCVLLICAVLVCSAAFLYGFRHSCAEKWEKGWKAWEAGDAALALKEWSAGRFFAPFDPGAPRIYYWKMRALESLGRKKEAEAAAALLASRFPLDFYTIALAGDPIMDEPDLHIASGVFKEGDIQLSKENDDLFEEEGINVTHYSVWDDPEEE